MAILMAVLLAASFPPEDDALPRSLQSEEEWSTVGGVLTARVGVWTGRSFDFKSVRTDSTQATSKQQALFSASILGGVEFFDHLVFLGTYEGDLASKITAQVGGGYVGWREHPKEKYGNGVPDEVLVHAGVLLGRIDIHKDDFGGFDRGVGFGGGLSFGWTLSSHAAVQLFGEYRYLRFDYQRDVFSGDKSIGGSAGWFGAGIDLRF